MPFMTTKRVRRRKTDQNKAVRPTGTTVTSTSGRSIRWKQNTANSILRQPCCFSSRERTMSSLTDFLARMLSIPVKSASMRSFSLFLSAVKGTSRYRPTLLSRWAWSTHSWRKTTSKRLNVCRGIRWRRSTTTAWPMKLTTKLLHRAAYTVRKMSRKNN